MGFIENFGFPDCRSRSGSIELTIFEEVVDSVSLIHVISFPRTDNET